MDKQPKSGDQVQIVDAKGRNRGFKDYVVCPLCESGRWVRHDSIKKESFTGMCQHCHNKIIVGRRETHGRWVGGKIKGVKDYSLVRVEESDPMVSMRSCGKYAYEHRLVMARHIGRPLFSWELVHHKDKDRKNNAIENLVLLEDMADHATSVAIQKEVQKLERKIAMLEDENMVLRKTIEKNHNSERVFT